MNIQKMIDRTITKVFGMLIGMAVIISCHSEAENQRRIRQEIDADTLLTAVKKMARETVKTGFNAGDGYQEVWIRDFNTFIGLATELHDKDVIKDQLRVFFNLQDSSGSVVDGFVPQDQAHSSGVGYDYVFLDTEPEYAGHKNTVETDQESSLVQAVFKYISRSADRAFLAEEIHGITVADRLERAMEFLLDQRYEEEYGLLWGATTADWGDVQPEHEWGVYLDDSSHLAIDIYDNAMFLIALDHLIEMLPDSKDKWQPIRDQLAHQCIKHLWDSEAEKFVPHIYLDESPFPSDFHEEQVYYHGGTAVAIEAGLLTKGQVGQALQRMKENVEQAGGATIGLTLYPTYPENSFKNPSMHPYGYQNGGDWDWFGGRMVLQLIRYGFVEEAYRELQPMLHRAQVNDGFYEWYDAHNMPQGSGTFRGSAGVLYDAIVLLETYVEAER